LEMECEGTPQEVEEKVGDLRNWTRTVVDCPAHQSNSDSGLFVIKFAECECYDISQVQYYNYCNYNLCNTPILILKPTAFIGR
jgi:hypothetical protein